MSRGRDDEGATALEFALVVPLLTGLLSFGMFFGWVYFQQSQLDHAAVRAARYASVPVNTNGTYAFCKDKVLAEADSWMVKNDITDAELTLTDRVGSAPATCPGKAPDSYVRVRLTHSFTNPFTEIVSTFLPVNGTWTITASAERRVETP